MELYRPEWTCGRFFRSSKNKSVALMYNLIEGTAHFFEDESAELVGSILSHKKSSEVSIERLEVAVNYEFSVEELYSFCDELIDVGLLTYGKLDSEKIREIRRKSGVKRIQNENSIARTVQEKLPFFQADAENSYMDVIDAERVPFTVMLELTYNCNEKCIHCFNPGASRNEEEKDTRTNRVEIGISDYEKLLDELQALGVVKIILTGGDPFVKRDIWQLIKLIYDRDFALDIYTNGLALRGKIETLANSYPRSIGLSIYSANDDVHDGITRVKGSLAKTTSIAAELADWGVPLYFKCPIMNNNAKSYFSIVELAKVYGAIPQIDVSLTDAVDGDNSITESLQVDGELLEIILRDPNIPLYVGKEAPNFGKLERNPNNAFCGAGTSLMNITPEGDITPCNSFPTQFGNLKDISFKDVWQNSKPLIDWQGILIKDYEECGTHERCNYCNRCPGQSFIEHGTPLKASSANCHVANVRMSLANNLRNGIDPLNGKKLEERLQDVSNTTTKVYSNKNSPNFRGNPLKF